MKNLKEVKLGGCAIRESGCGSHPCHSGPMRRQSLMLCVSVIVGTHSTADSKQREGLQEAARAKPDPQDNLAVT